MAFSSSTFDASTASCAFFYFSSGMRRAPKEGQKPRRLHENATSCSWAHSLQRHREAPAIHYEDSWKELMPPLMLNRPLPTAK